MSGTGHCKPGEEHDYRSCFRGCIASLSVSEGDYQPGDVPSNCTAGCAQTTCGHEPE